MQPALDDAVVGRLVVTADITVRLCAAGDLPKLEWFGAFAHHREIFAREYERHLRGTNLMLVADLHGFPVGQAWADVEKRRAESIGVIWAVRVLPPLQGLGVGSALVQSAEQCLRARGFRRAELGVETWNVDARRLYDRLGYRLEDEIREVYSYTTPDGVQAGHLVDQWILRKDLGMPQDPGGDGEPPDQPRRSG